MKEFHLDLSGDKGEGNITKQVLEFVIYDGDSTLHTNGELSATEALQIVNNHNLTDFMKTRNYRKVVVD